MLKNYEVWSNVYLLYFYDFFENYNNIKIKTKIRN